MRLINTFSATVLVYTMVLVVIGVFMATVVLNIAVQLSVEYDNRNIEVSMASIIKTKGDLSIKYAKTGNTSGSGFIDIISCPTGISMSGSTVRTTGIDTDIRFIDNSVTCVASSAHNGEDLNIYFNANYDDLSFAEFNGRQIAVNSGALVGVFSDSESTVLTLSNTSYFSPDTIDDNFDSDNYTISSTGSSLYPDGYIDNDADSRLLQYGYILEGSGLYNAFWSNSRVQQYIEENPFNTNTLHQKLGSIPSGRMTVDINGDHVMYLYQIDKATYDDTNELRITDILTGTGQTGGVGYLQNDLSIASGTGSAYDFDFITHDYALFIENTGSGALLYQIRGEDAVSGSGVYINPLSDSEPSIFSYLGSHMLVNDEGRLIGDMFEVFGLK